MNRCSLVIAKIALAITGFAWLPSSVAATVQLTATGNVTSIVNRTGTSNAPPAAIGAPLQLQVVYDAATAPYQTANGYYGGVTSYYLPLGAVLRVAVGSTAFMYSDGTTATTTFNSPGGGCAGYLAYGLMGALSFSNTNATTNPYQVSMGVFVTPPYPTDPPLLRSANLPGSQSDFGVLNPPAGGTWGCPSAQSSFTVSVSSTDWTVSGTIDPNTLKVSPFTEFGWPLASATVQLITQSFATFNDYVLNKYHTGLDIAAAHGDGVFPVATGDVVLIQLNGGRVDPAAPCKYQKSKPSNCADHGDGNTVLIKHTLLDGSIVFTQYQHLDTISEPLLTQCGTPNATTLTAVCAAGTTVTMGTTLLGTVGGTGYGQPAFYGTHLHVEAKKFGTLGTASGEFGYTTSEPSSIGFVDPITLLSATKLLNASVPLKPVSSSQLVLGPGELGSVTYATINSTDTYVTKAFQAVREAPGTTACSAGWYQVQLASATNPVRCDKKGQCFAYQATPKVSLPAVWVCKSAVAPAP